MVLLRRAATVADIQSTFKSCRLVVSSRARLVTSFCVSPSQALTQTYILGMSATKIFEILAVLAIIILAIRYFKYRG